MSLGLIEGDEKSDPPKSSLFIKSNVYWRQTAAISNKIINPINLFQNHKKTTTLVATEYFGNVVCSIRHGKKISTFPKISTLWLKEAPRHSYRFLKNLAHIFFGNLFESSLFFVIAAPNKFIFNSSNF